MPASDPFADTAHRRAFGEAVARVRLSRGWTQEDLAEHAAMHRSYLAGIEVGARNPTLDVIVRLANALDVTAGDLIVIAPGSHPRA